MWEAVAQEFASSPIASIGAIVSVVASIAGAAYALVMLAKRNARSEQGGFDDHAESRSYSTLVGVFLTIAMTIVTPVGFALAAKIGFVGGLWRGIASIFLSYGLCITFLGIVCGMLMRDWVTDNATLHYDDKNARTRKDYVIKIGGIKLEDFENVGFLIAGLCVFMYWFVSGEDFYQFLSGVGLTPDPTTSGGIFAAFYFAIAGSLLFGVFVSGFWVKLLFGIYSGLKKNLPLLAHGIMAEKSGREKEK